MEKINIAELLKDCPKGMELDCTMYDDVYFDCIDQEYGFIKCYIQDNDYKTSISFTEYGCYTGIEKSKCVIFPKGKTTWEGFQRPFKDGDIITCTNHCCTFVAIYKGMCNKDSFYRYACLILDETMHFNPNTTWSDFTNPRFATEEEKEKLFQAIKENGYRWNAKKKELEKLIEPKFKVGDRIKHRLTGDVYKVLFVLLNGYGGGVYDVAITNEMGKSIDIKEQDEYELLPNKFDINTLKPFDKVLVRTDNVSPVWTIAFYDGYKTHISGCFRPFGVSNGEYFQQCIPYEGNEHLRGTTNECSEYYKNWK